MRPGNRAFENIAGLANKLVRVKSWPINYPHFPAPPQQQVAAYAAVFNPLKCKQPGSGRRSPFQCEIPAGKVKRMRQEKSHRADPGQSLNDPLGDRYCLADVLSPDLPHRHRRRSVAGLTAIRVQSVLTPYIVSRILPVWLAVSIILWAAGAAASGRVVPVTGLSLPEPNRGHTDSRS